MPSDYTPNYKLSQWEKSDQVLMQDFNRDNAAIDEALKTAADALIRKGNCEIWTYTYYGAGQTGSKNPNSITFPQKPLFALVIGSDGSFGVLRPGARTLYVHNSLTYDNSVSWSNNTVTWSTTTSATVGQLNAAGATYHVFAFYKMDQEE